MNFKIENINNKPIYRVNYKNEIRKFIPEEVSALILKELKRTTEESTGKKINGCVITVPAYFTNNEREATLFAAELAGLEVLQLLNEPTAAAIAYGFEHSIDGNIIVFDFGGGTLDVSVVKIKNLRYLVMTVVKHLVVEILTTSYWSIVLEFFKIKSHP